jgi:hypothetical protein
MIDFNPIEKQQSLGFDEPFAFLKFQCKAVSPCFSVLSEVRAAIIT